MSHTEHIKFAFFVLCLAVCGNIALNTRKDTLHNGFELSLAINQIEYKAIISTKVRKENKMENKSTINSINSLLINSNRYNNNKTINKAECSREIMMVQTVEVEWEMCERCVSIEAYCELCTKNLKRGASSSFSHIFVKWRFIIVMMRSRPLQNLSNILEDKVILFHKTSE